MTHWIPTTQVVRNAYAFGESGEISEVAEAKAEFNRWLAQEKAAAWEEGHIDGCEDQPFCTDTNLHLRDNPYKNGDTL